MILSGFQSQSLERGLPPLVIEGDQQFDRSMK